MLAVFSPTVVTIPESLRPSAAELGEGANSLMGHFSATRDGAVILHLGSNGAMAYSPKEHVPSFSRFLAVVDNVVDNVFCLFKGHVENTSFLKKKYSLCKHNNGAFIAIEAYNTFRFKGPPFAGHFLRDIQGEFAFIVFNVSSNDILVAADASGRMPFFWGADSEGHLVLSDDLDIVKKGCGGSVALFPRGFFFTTSGELKSFQH